MGGRGGLARANVTRPAAAPRAQRGYQVQQHTTVDLLRVHARRRARAVVAVRAGTKTARRGHAPPTPASLAYYTASS